MFISLLLFSFSFKIVHCFINKYDSILNLINLVPIRFVISDPEKLIVHSFRTIT
jgi:hypothetical protein